MVAGRLIEKTRGGEPFRVGFAQQPEGTEDRTEHKDGDEGLGVAASAAG